MYPIPPTETLVQTKTCRHCSAFFPITDKDLEFYEKVSPVFPLQPSPPTPLPEGEGRKVEWDKIRYLIPPPTLCPDCRQQRRLSFRNERKLYKRKCDATNKDIISIYSPDKPFKVYHQDYWWSDKWDPMEYGRDFDFGRGFFEQFGELARMVPRIGLYRDPSMENSEYTNYGQGCKSCYLCVNCYLLSDSYYSTSCFPFGHGEETACVDSEDCTDSSDIYASNDLKMCSLCGFSQFLESCFNCWFSQELNGCSFCLCSVNQVNKKFLILNQSVSETEFESTRKKMLTDEVFRKEMLERYHSLVKTLPVRHSQNVQSENITGDHIIHSKNVHSSYFVGTTENGKYMYVSGYYAKNVHDGMNSGGKSDGTYETLHTHADFQSAFLIDVDESRNIYYSCQCYSSSHLFWCIGLRNKQYCILNKQYTKDEYEALVPKIIEHMMKSPLTPLSKGGSDEGAGGFEWWEFFPSSLSPFGYNETVAQEYYPLTREEVLSPLSSEGEGSGVRFNWSDYEAPFPRVEKIIPADKLPDDITKIPDDILNWAIECEVTKKPFRIIKQELEFYRKHHLPIPRRHPDQRHLDRMALRNPRKLFERKCDKCGVEIVTTYSPERKETVYCEKCYEKEVVGNVPV